MDKYDHGRCIDVKVLFIDDNIELIPQPSIVDQRLVDITRSENCRKWVLANRHSHNWEQYLSRLHTESYNTPHWSDRQTGFPRILLYAY